MKKALLALFLCFCLLLSGSVKPFFSYASLDDGELEEPEMQDEPEDDSSASDSVEAKYKDEMAALSEKLKALDSENKKIQNNINDAKDEKARKQAEKDAIDRQISITREQISALLERIDLLELDISDKERDINDKQGEIESKQGEIDDNYEILRKRLRSKYMQDTTTTLGLIVGADSFSDLLTRVEYIKRIADHDRKLLQELGDQRKALEAEKIELEDKLNALEDVQEAGRVNQAETESKKAVLDTQSQKAQLQVEDLAEMERAFMADLQKNKQIQEAAKAELDRIYREIEWSKNAYVGGVMAWPLPDYIPGRNLSITSRFGPRFQGTDNHTGVDLSGSGISGHNIVAANDGTIVKANTTFTPGVGYGRYVLIDHGVQDGKSISTLYGHCSSLSVSVGQEVKKGQVIAQVGSTGWSSGPHLHFEVRINGTCVNPEPYIFS